MLFNEQLAMRVEPFSWPEASAPSQLGAQHKERAESGFIVTETTPSFPKNKSTNKGPRGESPGLRVGISYHNQISPHPSALV